MKKFLAILLSVIMLFTLGVAAFAEGENVNEGMPKDTPKQAGKVVFSIQNTYIEPSKEYSIPIIMKSDYLEKVPENAETFYFGFSGISFSTSEKDIVEIKNIRFSDKIAADDQLVVNQVDLENGMDGSLAFKIKKADFNKFFSTSDEGIVIGYIDVVTTEDVPEEYNKDFGRIVFFPYFDLYSEDDEGNPNGCVADPNASGCSVGYTDAEGNFTGIFLNESENDEIVLDTACFYHAPYVPTWQERLKVWGKAQGHLIVNFFITILEVLDSFLTK